MRRTISLLGVLPFVSAFLGGALALHVFGPHPVDAQESRLQAESFVVVDESGVNRAIMSTAPRERSLVQVLSREGLPRIQMATGGNPLFPQATDEARIVVFPPEGSLIQGSPGSIAALGSGIDGTGATLQLSDRQGQIRILLRVDVEGDPSIEMLDARGNVTWSAP